MRFAAGGFVAQAGAGVRVLDEASAAVDGEQRHGVEEAHAQAADQHGAGPGHTVHALVDGVAGAQPGVAGIRQFLLRGGETRGLPAECQDGGVGGEGGAVGEGEQVGVGAGGAEVDQAGVVTQDGDRLRQEGQRDVEDPAQVGAVEGPRRVRVRAGDGGLLREGGGDLRLRGMLREQPGPGSLDLLAAQVADPLVEGRPLDDGGLDGGARFGEQGRRPGEGVHAHGAGLLRVPDAAGAVLGVVDEVEGEAGAGRQLGREALDDGDPAGTQSDDGDGGGGGHGVLPERKFSEWRITKGSVRDVGHTGNVPEQLPRPRSGGVGMYRP